MKKYFLSALLLAVAAFSCFAQQDSRTSIGIDAGLPVGSSANDFAFAIGGSLKIENGVGDNALIIVSMGYVWLPSKTTLVGANVKPPTTIFAPLKVGLKYKLAGPLFAEAQTGAAFEIRGRRTTRFVYAGGLVCNINRFDLGIRYEGWDANSSTISQIALRLGYRL